MLFNRPHVVNSIKKKSARVPSGNAPNSKGDSGINLPRLAIFDVNLQGISVVTPATIDQP